ncbi:MAG: flavin reductase family protein [Bacteroidota bacterium]
MKQFKRIAARDISEGAVNLIGFEWMLITAGTPEDYNMMTAAWGGLGFLWNKPVAYIFIRPQRYTYRFVENSSYFTLQFFDHSYRKMLNYCGTRSGRDVNKAEETGLSTFTSPNNGVYFDQSRLQMECRKIYFNDLVAEHFIDPDINKHYPENDYHRMYIGEITECLVKI